MTSGGRFYASASGRTNAGHVQWLSTPSDWDISQLQTHSAKKIRGKFTSFFFFSNRLFENRQHVSFV